MREKEREANGGSDEREMNTKKTYTAKSQLKAHQILSLHTLSLKIQRERERRRLYSLLN